MAFHHGEHAAAGQFVTRGLRRYIIGVGAGIAHEHLGHALGVRDAFGVTHGARRFVEVHDFLGGDHAARAVLHDLVDVAGVIVVGGKRHFALEVLHRFDVREVVFRAKRRVFVRGKHFEQQLFLHVARVLHVRLKLRAKCTARFALLFEHHAAQRCHVGHLRGRRRSGRRFGMGFAAGKLVDSFISRHGVTPYCSTVRMSVKPVASSTSLMYSLG